MTWPIDCVLPYEPLANHTSFRIGGPAEWFAEPTNPDELAQVLRQASRLGLPVSVIGGGTNTLAADRGSRGLVIHLGRGFRTIRDVNDPDAPTARVICGASLLTQRLVYLSAQHGWGDLETFAGLPGHLGGAVAMNAQDIGRFIREITIVGFDGAVRRMTREQIRYSYRYMALEPGIIVEAALEFPKIPQPEAYERIRKAINYRNESQELRLPSAGCAFKNPAGNSAGRLIDQAGLKGTRIGDAMVSPRHANFIVNLGQATCDDVLSLMEYVQRRVNQIFRVVLEPEVRLVGERW
jgi:UDP-N-acetylmuramate dehydrogenase